MFIVRYHAEAITDLEGLKARNERKATFNVVDKLARLGTQLLPPHMKKLKGESDWCELRPRQGQSPVRPIYRREDADEFVIYAIAVEADKADFNRAVENAKARRAADEKVREARKDGV